MSGPVSAGDRGFSHEFLKNRSGVGVTPTPFQPNRSTTTYRKERSPPRRKDLSPPRPLLQSRPSALGSFKSSGLEHLKGLYLVKFAVGVMAFYLIMQLLISFAEVVLPFIFAVLLGVVLEPMKMFILRILKGLTIRCFVLLNLRVCLVGLHDGHHPRDGGPTRTVRGDSVSDGENQYVPISGRPDSFDSGDYHLQSEEQSKKLVRPVESIQKMNLLIAMITCIVTTGRISWLILRVFYRSGQVIAGSMEHYQKGVHRIKVMTQHFIKDTHLQSLDWGSVLDDLVTYLNLVAEVATESLTGALVIVSMALIFLLYLLWSPVKIPENSITQEVFRTAGRYLKIKVVISAFAGATVAVTLWLLDLELPAAFGLLTFLLRFLPGIGDFVASVLPCLLAIIDIRKSASQTFIALTLLVSINFSFQLVVEPIWFNVSMEIHPVVVILGIFFLKEIWGVPGMLLSVPIMAIARLLLKIMRKEVSGEDAATVVAFDRLLEGKWMSTLGGDDEDSEAGQEFILGESHVHEGEQSKSQVMEGSGLCYMCQSSPLLRRIGVSLDKCYQEWRLIFDMIFLTFCMALIWVPTF